MFMSGNHLIENQKVAFFSIYPRIKSPNKYVEILKSVSICPHPIRFIKGYAAGPYMPSNMSYILRRV